CRPPSGRTACQLPPQGTRLRWLHTAWAWARYHLQVICCATSMPGEAQSIQLKRPPDGHYASTFADRPHTSCLQEAGARFRPDNTNCRDLVVVGSLHPGYGLLDNPAPEQLECAAQACGLQRVAQTAAHKDRPRKYGIDPHIGADERRS